jgi:rRNA processing protein Gar1
LAAYQSTSVYVYQYLKQAALEAIYEWYESQGNERPPDEIEEGFKTTTKSRMDAKLSSSEMFKVLCLMGFARANATKSSVINAYFSGRDQPRFTVSAEDVVAVREDTVGQIDDVVGVLSQQYGSVASDNDIDLPTMIRHGVLGARRYRDGQLIDANINALASVGTRTRKPHSKPASTPKPTTRTVITRRKPTTATVADIVDDDLLESTGADGL